MPDQSTATRYQAMLRGFKLLAVKSRLYGDSPIFVSTPVAVDIGLLAVWAREYVAAARATGPGALAITRHQVLPHIASAISAQAAISFATAILASTN